MCFNIFKLLGSWWSIRASAIQGGFGDKTHERSQVLRLARIVAVAFMDEDRDLSV